MSKIEWNHNGNRLVSIKVSLSNGQVSPILGLFNPNDSFTFSSEKQIKKVIFHQYNDMDIAIIEFFDSEQKLIKKIGKQNTGYPVTLKSLELDESQTLVGFKTALTKNQSFLQFEPKIISLKLK